MIGFPKRIVDQERGQGHRLQSNNASHGVDLFCFDEVRSHVLISSTLVRNYWLIYTVIYFLVLVRKLSSICETISVLRQSEYESCVR